MVRYHFFRINALVSILIKKRKETRNDTKEKLAIVNWFHRLLCLFNKLLFSVSIWSFVCVRFTFSIFLSRSSAKLCVAAKFSFLAAFFPPLLMKFERLRVQGIAQHLRDFFCSRNCNNPNCFGYIRPFCNHRQLIALL